MNRATPTGTISLSDVNAELNTTGVINMSDQAVRDLAGLPTGPISMSDLQGKSAIKLPPNKLILDCYSTENITITVKGSITVECPDGFFTLDNPNNWAVPGLQNENWAYDGVVNIYHDVISELKINHTSAIMSMYGTYRTDDTYVSSIIGKYGKYPSEAVYGDYTIGKELIIDAPNATGISLSSVDDVATYMQAYLSRKTFERCKSLREVINLCRNFRTITICDDVFNGLSTLAIVDYAFASRDSQSTLGFRGTAAKDMFNGTSLSRCIRVFNNSLYDTADENIPKIWESFNLGAGSNDAAYRDSMYESYGDFTPISTTLGVPASWY